MHPNSVLGGPIFITRYLNTDQAVARNVPRCHAALLTANFATTDRFANLVTVIREGCERLLVDPVTHSFTYPGFLDKSTYTALPYAPDNVISASTLLGNAAELRSVVQETLSFQQELNADILIAPYFYARDLDDPRLRANIRLISESRGHLGAGDNVPPLFAMICIGGVVLDSPPQVDDLARQYLELDVQGYLITVENLDDRSASAERLMGLAQLVSRLQVDRDIVIASIASYGQVLTALGANGFSAGVGWLETFREASLQPGRIPFAADRTPRAQYYYIPEILSYVHPDELQTLFDSDTGSETMRERWCQCDVCQGNTLPTEVGDKKRHFLLRRHQEMHELGSAAPKYRPQHMRQRLEEALELANIIEEEALIRIPTEHFVRWIAIIDTLMSTSRSAPTDVDPAELDRTIQEARRRPDDTDRP